MNRSWQTLWVAMLFAVSVPAPAAGPTECTGTPAPPPAGMEGWAKPAPLVAGATDAAAAPLAIGQAVEVRLPVAAMRRFAQAPGLPAASGHGGMMALSLSAGTYRIALGGAAWVDLTGSGKEQASVGHGHGPACSGIRKMVNFAVADGRYVLRLSGSEAPVVRVMVTRLR